MVCPECEATIADDSEECPKCKFTIKGFSGFERWMNAFLKKKSKEVGKKSSGIFDALGGR